MANIATKTPPRDDGLVALLAISTNMIHEPDMSADRSGTILCPISKGKNSRGISQ